VIEYLTIQELSDRLKVAKQTIYNWVSMGRFQAGLHYMKPSRRRLLFVWSAIEAWLRQSATIVAQPNTNGKGTAPLRTRGNRIRI